MKYKASCSNLKAITFKNTSEMRNIFSTAQYSTSQKRSRERYSSVEDVRVAIDSSISECISHFVVLKSCHLVSELLSLFQLYSGRVAFSYHTLRSTLVIFLIWETSALIAKVCKEAKKCRNKVCFARLLREEIAGICDHWYIGKRSWVNVSIQLIYL